MNKTIEKLQRQQAALADFGSYAFSEVDLQPILTEAARVCAASLGVPYAKICRYRPLHNDLLVVAGCGWHDGVIGRVKSPADRSSTQGRAFSTGDPVILTDIAKSKGYTLPAFYAEHGIVATMDVLIKGRGGPWGVLEIDSCAPRQFDGHDIDFLTGFANVLAEAAATAERMADLRIVVERTKSLLGQKEKLLDERREREIRLHDLQAELLRVARLNMMSQMTAAIAHEINQPLTAIANYVAAIRRTLQAGEPDASSRAYEIIDKTADQAKRAGEIVRNWRAFVEKREGVRTSQNLPSLIEKSLGLANHTGFEDNVTLSLRLDAKLGPVLIDAVQIQQVLVNLIRNGVEAMRQCDKREMTIVAEPGTAGFANVTIQDTGPGLPPDILKKLFQPFVTTKDTGMGLGLSICEVLVKANGGRISLVKGLREGTGFCFTLPLALAAAAPESRRESASSAVR